MKTYCSLAAPTRDFSLADDYAEDEMGAYAASTRA